MKNLGVLIILTLFSGSGLAQNETKCDLSAFVSDSASGVNVRAGAGKDFQIIKTVPKDKGRTMVDVVGAKGDWLKVTNAVNSKSETVFSGSGWVLAALLSIKTGDAEALKEKRLKVYKSPNKSGGLIPFTDFGIELALQGCLGNWIKVRLPRKGTGTATDISAWMSPGTYCGNPWIECD